jgi:hypothetical protein
MKFLFVIIFFLIIINIEWIFIEIQMIFISFCIGKIVVCVLLTLIITFLRYSQLIMKICILGIFSVAIYASIIKKADLFFV